MVPIQKHTRFVGVHGSSRAWLVSTLTQRSKTMLVLCRDRTAAEELRDDLEFFVRDRPVRLLNSWDILPFEPVSPEAHLSAERIACIDAIARGKPLICVTSIDVLLQRVVPRDLVSKLGFSLESGQTLSRDTLVERLVSNGYNPVSLVEELGEFAVRGSVLDFFGSSHPQPVRVEFLEDTIERMRLFDPESQRSTETIDRIEVLAAREAVPLAPPSPFASMLPGAIERVKARAKQTETPAREVAQLLSALKTNAQYPGIEHVQAILLPTLDSIASTLPADTIVVRCDDTSLAQAGDQFLDLVAEREERLFGEHQLIPPKEAMYLSSSDLERELAKFQSVHLDQINVIEEGEIPEEQPLRIQVFSNLELATKLTTRVGTGQALEPLRKKMNLWRKKGFSVGFVVGSEHRAQRLQRMLLDIDVSAEIVTQSGLGWLRTRRQPVAILLGQLSAGMQLPDEQVVFISEREIFKERSVKRSGAGRISVKRLMSSLAQLKEGDYVVHVDYGVGIYRGLKHIELEESAGDFLQLEYADSRLYLPVHNITKIQKFVAAEGQTPVLDKLASTKWAKTKIKVRESVAALAGDLIKLYAGRSVAKGWRFEPMGAEDERFGDGFPYQETPDQLKAITDVVSDMSSEQPMDRLVCGDVGFGKTEVAIRAAFKCIQHARQVAVLVPTTILVEQHKQSFVNRFLGYPVRIEAVSRFYPPAQNKATLEAVASGQVDIVIGTHRLLQNDVHFKDLGLLIVDEEHRFGVKQKERLKQVKKQVDVLTLTATPIPRTLHMSLLGIRDISVITTPPQDRRTIRTYVASHNDTLIRDAILRELQRGGQTFFLHNRVQSIMLATERLRGLVPEARFEFAHGQMDERELERIMKRFLDREIDVLVSTTIIESGLDVPNANTIIIDRADTMGLAQLYQIRGRVGRSTRQAYAYLLVPGRKIGADAQKRLRVLQSLDDLGLGFNLAMNDLEIRGAGNLLGKEQSGSVLAVGFDLYTKILREAVLHLKGEEPHLDESLDPDLKFPIHAFIPEPYVPDVSERLVLYQRLAAVASDAEGEALAEEIEDRFGPFGPEVRNLVTLMQLRGTLRRLGATRAELANDRVLITLSPRAPIEFAKLDEMIRAAPESMRLTKGLVLSLALAPAEHPDIGGIYDKIRGITDSVTRPTDLPSPPELPRIPAYE